MYSCKCLKSPKWLIDTSIDGFFGPQIWPGKHYSIRWSFSWWVHFRFKSLTANREARFSRVVLFTSHYVLWPFIAPFVFDSKQLPFVLVCWHWWILNWRNFYKKIKTDPIWGFVHQRRSWLRNMPGEISTQH